MVLASVYVYGILWKGSLASWYVGADVAAGVKAAVDFPSPFPSYPIPQPPILASLSLLWTSSQLHPPSASKAHFS